MNPTPPLMPSTRRCCDAEQFDEAGDCAEAAAEKRREYQPATHVDAAVTRRRRIETRNDHFISDVCLAQKRPNQAAGEKRDENASVGARAGNDEGEPGLGGQPGALRQFPGCAHRPRDQILDEEDGDIIRHQRDQDLVTAVPRPHDPNQARPRAADHEAEKERERKKHGQRRRPGRPAGARMQAEPRCGGRAEDEAALEPEIPESGAPADDRPQRDQRQRGGAYERESELPRAVPKASRISAQ